MADENNLVFEQPVPSPSPITLTFGEESAPAAVDPAPAPSPTDAALSAVSQANEAIAKAESVLTDVQSAAGAAFAAGQTYVNEASRNAAQTDSASLTGTAPASAAPASFAATAPAPSAPGAFAAAAPAQAAAAFAAAAPAPQFAGTPFGGAAVQSAAAAAQDTESIFTPEEQAQVDAFAERIDIHNSNAIMQYGAGTQKKMSDFSDLALENVKNKDMGEVGKMISGLVTELTDFDVKEDDGGIFKFFKKQTNKVVAMKAKYEKTEKSVDDIVHVLEGHQIQLLKDVATLDKMYDMNLQYFKELSMYIAAGKKRLAQVRAGELKQLQEKAAATGDAQDAQAAKDLGALCDRFEKKLHDLELTRQIAIQTGPQIRLVQDADTLMAEKIQSTIVNTIPLWKNQMVIAMGVEHSNQAAKAQHEVSELTNNLLKKNAEQLHTASVETAKESERGIVDIETLKKTNAELIATLDDVLKIQEDGRQRRQAAEIEMSKMETELKAKLLELSKTSR
ncbi:MAG TPA: toxic anion resistance protein [Lachnospiraceae bacterium]|nr:toxic anion resistance protein [Lachnospiraceae bacterium]